MQDFERIYAEHADAVRAYVRRRAPRDLVEDVVSETFVVCLRRLAVVPAEPLPWLYARREEDSRERTAQGRSRIPGTVEVAYEPEPVGDAELARAFAQLSERDREVLRLVAWEALSLRDAATVLGCSAVACRVRYHRAKSRLAGRLEAAASFRPSPKGVTR